MHRIKRLGSNSVVQAFLFGLLFTAVVSRLWEVPVKEYHLEVEPFERRSGGDIYWFAGDFDRDGNSEIIRCYNSDMTGVFNVVHYDEEGNLTDTWHMNTSMWNYYFRPAIFDIDNNGSDELLFLTFRNDSIFLNALNLVDFNFIIDHHYFETIERKRKTYAFQSGFSRYGDFDNNGVMELFFWFDAGYGLYPRGIFKLEYPSLDITASPTEHIRLNFSAFHELTGDSIPEILTTCVAPFNSLQSIKYSDSVGYVVVLDYNLNLLFEPIPVGGDYSSVRTIPAGDNQSFFYALVQDRSNSEEAFKLMSVNGRGEILAMKKWGNIEFPEKLSAVFKVINSAPKVFFDDIGQFDLTQSLDEVPDKLEYKEGGGIMPFHETDLNNDGYDEWISWTQNNNFTIYNEKGNISLSFPSPIPVGGEFNIFSILNENEVVKHMLTFKNGYFFIRYYKNPWFFVKYIIYIGLFITISGLVLLLLYLQKKSLENRWKAEKQLSELQFNAVKNQLHPHFMFNALNSVAHLINNGQHDEAYDFLTINSRMIQQVMNDAKEVKRTLKSEIRFTRDYLAIQKQRFKNKFEVEFEVHPEVDMNFTVPKMCIHTYVENAVKHGFRETKTGGFLRIEVRPLPSGVFIAVADNGMGRMEASKNKSSSGHGLSIMEEFYRLFEKYHRYSISYRYIDVNPEAIGHNGLKVELEILHDSWNKTETNEINLNKYAT